MTCILMFIYKSGSLDIIPAWNKSLVGKKKQVSMLKKVFRYQYSTKDEEQISKMKWNIVCKHEFLSLNSVALQIL